MSNIKLECHEANHICDKNQYKEASFMEKVVLTIHLIYCRACRQYTKKNTKLTKVITKKPVKLEASSRESLKSAFEKELANQQ